MEKQEVFPIFHAEVSESPEFSVFTKNHAHHAHHAKTVEKRETQKPSNAILEPCKGCIERQMQLLKSKNKITLLEKHQTALKLKLHQLQNELKKTTRLRKENDQLKQDKDNLCNVC